MQDEFDALTDLNLQIGYAESAGDKESLEKHLAPVLALRRANGDCVDKQHFLEKVAKGAPRETAIESIDLVGRDRAVVTCVVSMGDGEQQKCFHNIRLFVRMRMAGNCLVGQTRRCDGVKSAAAAHPAMAGHLPGGEQVPLVMTISVRLDGQLGSVWVAWLNDGRRQHDRRLRGDHAGQRVPLQVVVCSSGG